MQYATQIVSLIALRITDEPGQPLTNTKAQNSEESMICAALMPLGLRIATDIASGLSKHSVVSK